MKRISKKWRELLTCLPGYDPFAQAGDCWFDEAEAELRVAFVELGCTHVKGDLSGKPIMLEDWQKALHGNLFGWKKPNGKRRFRESLVYVPRGNAKTTNAATIVLSVLCLDGEPGAECYSSAAERDQARLCFECVQGMIENNSDMESMMQVFKYSIVAGDNSYKAISADAKSKHGYNAHLVVNDELHAHRDEELTETLMTSTLKRSQPLVVHLTTSDYDRPSICNQKLDYAKKVRDNIISDPAFLPVIYESQPDEPWDHPDTWAKCNPNWPVMDHEYFARECERAKVDPAYRNTFKRLHLNLKTTANVSAVDMLRWDGCEPRKPIEDVITRPCVAALDVSSKSDLTAFVVAAPEYSEVETGAVVTGLDVWSWFWVPQSAVNRRSDEKSLFATYSGWQESGDLFVQSGERIDQSEIRQFINDLRDNAGWQIEAIAYDPWNAEAIRQGLHEDGFEMIEFQQSLRNFSEPMKDLISLVTEHKVRHGGHPVLRWNASNCVAYTDANGNMRPDKKNSIDKIDGMVALIMAHGMAMRQRVEATGGLILL